MRKIISIYCKSIITLLLSCSLVTAQNKPVKFDRLTTKDGLSQNKVFDIVQDKLGFIWIATEDGLNRYDGYKFKMFKNTPGDTTSLSNNLLQTLYITNNGDLWIGSRFEGLSKFNYETETFINYRNDHFDQNSLIGNWVSGISEDAKGNLWIATGKNGFDYLNVSTNTFYHMANLVPQGYEINNEFLTFIYQDKQDHLWLGGK